MKSPLQQGAWLAICDGSKALLVENKGDHVYPKLETRAHFAQENPPSHEQGTAQPGRAFSSAGGRRGATEETDYHDQAEQAFLRNFATEVAHAVAQNKITNLHLIAPPRALHVMREALPAAVHRVLAGEIDRDYVKLPLHEVERHLLALEKKQK
jgi:protein required for attachment to host cells